MYLFNKLLRKIHFFLKDKNGMFNILTILIFMLIICIIAFAKDLSRIYFIRSHMQNSIESAVLSVCTALITEKLDKNTIEERLKEKTKHHMAEVFDPEEIAQIQEAKISIHYIHPMQHKIRLESTYELESKDFILGDLVSKCIPNITCISTGMIQRDFHHKTALSLNMVLDVSGSMHYVDSMTDEQNRQHRIAATSVQNPSIWGGAIQYQPQESRNKQKRSGGLFNSSKKAPKKNTNNRIPNSPIASPNLPEPTQKVSPIELPNSRLAFLKEASKTLVNMIQEGKKTSARIGIIAYNHGIEDQIPLTSNFSGINNKIEQLTASGGTNSFDAMKLAHSKLNPETSERRSHNLRDDEILKRYIVLITDGENSVPNRSRQFLDSETIKICEQAHRDNITVYTVSINAGPNGDKLLKYCASSEDHFHLVKNSQELANHFKDIASRIQPKNVRLIPN
ncbi:MAG: VWA domain-containing protein [Candidatus Liberibacter ctenarytainae]|uniref:VWA domain-containing protein n=1 Tax=Candidatus Liberibacter ctenarytainae TaxID=2020335 RepID=A0A937ASK1_9HYPH|nr:VWA domain-containing protein [Candidatus Liberibacter ctenarytainae]